MMSDHHGDDPVPFESNFTFSSVEQVLELRRGLRRRVVDLRLLPPSTSVSAIDCRLGSKTTSLTFPFLTSEIACEYVILRCSERPGSNV